MSHDGDGPSEAGFTLIEMMVAVSIFAVVLGVVCGSLVHIDQQAFDNIAIQQLSDTAMLGLNQVSVEVRDLSATYDNTVQAGDTGTADIVTMTATEIDFLSGDKVVSNDNAGIVDANGGSFYTGCANLIDIKLVSGNLVQTQTVPTLENGQCTWTASPGTGTLLQNIEPLCSGSPCSAASPGAAIFSYLQRYPNQEVPASTPAQVGEVTIGFAALPERSAQGTPVVFTQTVRLASVLADPSS